MLVLVAFAYAGSFYPATLRATVAYHEGQSAERARNFHGAIEHYCTVLDAYPDSREALVRLGVAYYRDGDTLQAVEVLGEVWRQDIPRDEARQVNRIFREIKKRAGVK